jgi:glycosyltransferase involved in cell wall biosynthesis
VAVIVPAYGVADLLGEALESLLAQGMADWECIVIDDGAPDDVAGAVAPYLSDPRIRFLATSNGGVGAARNRAIAASTAPLVTLLDADDLLCPDYMDRIVPVMEQDATVRLATPNARIFGSLPQPRLCVSAWQGTGDGVRGSLADVIDRSFNVYIGTTFRRADWQAVNGFDESMTHCEDLDFWVRLMQLGGDAFYVDAVLGEYRVRPGSASGAAERMIAGNLQVYRKALAALHGRSEASIVERMIALGEEELAFETAMSRVAAGDLAGGLPMLRAHKALASGPVWTLSFALWRIVPQLAPPMIRWRRRNHARGGGAVQVPPLHLREPRSPARP